MTAPHITPEMLSSARAEAANWRARAEAAERELTKERNMRLMAEGLSPWHPKQPLRERAPGFARQCSCDECKLICKVAGVTELQAQLIVAQGHPELAPLRAALDDAQKKFRQAEAKAGAANRRADAAEADARQLRERIDACRRHNEALRDRATEARDAAERAITRTRVKRRLMSQRIAQAEKALELAPYVRAAMRSGRTGLSAVAEAKAAVALQRGHA